VIIGRRNDFVLFELALRLTGGIPERVTSASIKNKFIGCEVLNNEEDSIDTSRAKYLPKNRAQCFESTAEVPL